MIFFYKIKTLKYDKIITNFDLVFSTSDLEPISNFILLDAYNTSLRFKNNKY